MLYLIGIGLKPEHLTMEAFEAIKKCSAVFIEDYTSEYSQGYAKDLKEIIGKDAKLLGRKEVEEGFESALLSARRNEVALLIFGNPLTATTHLQILLDAKEAGVKVKIIPGISITNMIAETGLDEYKFGRTVTICYHSKDFEPESFYEQIKSNKKTGLHTLCLLDIKKDEKPKRLMSSKEAIEVLKKIAAKRKENINLGKNAFEFTALLGMGSQWQKIIVGEEAITKSVEVKEIFPQSLIVLGKLNDKEKEALEKLHK